MCRQCFFAVVIASFLLSVCTGACLGKGIPASGNVTRHTLANGLNVLIVENRLAPVVATVMNYRVGSTQSPAGFPGMAHAEEHMMFRGSPGLTADQLANILAAMGGMFNADTEQTVTRYFLMFADRDLDIALRLEALRMTGILDDPKSWSQERGALEQEVSQDLSEPFYIFYANVLSRMFSGTPYEQTPLGTVASFRHTTPLMLKDFYRAWYKPNNAVLVIVGDVDPKETIEKVRRHFEPIPSGPLPKRRPVVPGPIAKETFRFPTDAFYGLAAISFRMPGYNDRDWAASQVLSDVLSSQRSDLFNLVIEGKAFYTGFMLNSFPELGIGHAVAMFPKGGDTEALIRTMREVMARGRDKGFPADLVEAARRTRLTKTELKKNSIMGFASAWSDAVVLEGRQSPDQTMDDIRRVTVDDVNRVARKYLTGDTSITTILYPEASGRPVAATGKTGPESPLPARVREVKPPAWAKKALLASAPPRLTVKPVVSRLDNGILLIVQPLSVSNTVSVYGYIKNEPAIQAPRGKEGIDEVLDQMLMYGTRSHDRIAFQKALDDIGAQLSPGTNFSLKALTDAFEPGVKLLADVELHPALPGNAFPVVRGKVRSAVAGRLSSPDYLAEVSARKALYPPGDPYLRQASPATVSAITLKDVEDYHQAVFRPDMTTIVVIGNVGADAARRVVEKYFGAWNAKGPRPDTRLPHVPPNKASRQAVPDRTRVQAKVLLAQTLAMGRSHPDYYALELGNTILGGAFYATRLYRELREETGLVYHVSSTLDMGETRSTYQIEFGCDPKNIPRIRSIILRNMSDMQKTAAPENEIEQAKALLLRRISLSESSVKKISTDLLDRVSKGVPVDEPARAARVYMELGAGDVLRAYARWIRPGDMIEVTEGPIE